MCTVEVKTWDWTFPRETDAQFNSRGLSWQSHWHIVALVPHSQSWSVNFWMWFLALKYGCLMGQNDCVMSVICPLNMVRKGLALLFCIQLRKHCQLSHNLGTKETRTPPTPNHSVLLQFSRSASCSAAAVLAWEGMTKGKYELSCI